MALSAFVKFPWVDCAEKSFAWNTSTPTCTKNCPRACGPPKTPLHILTRRPFNVWLPTDKNCIYMLGNGAHCSPTTAGTKTQTMAKRRHLKLQHEGQRILGARKKTLPGLTEGYWRIIQVICSSLQIPNTTGASRAPCRWKARKYVTLEAISLRKGILDAQGPYFPFPKSAQDKHALTLPLSHPPRPDPGTPRPPCEPSRPSHPPQFSE